MRRALLIAVGLVAGLTACSTAHRLEPAAGHARPTPSSTSAAGLSPVEARTAGIYVALLEQHLSPGGVVVPHSFLGRTPQGDQLPLSKPVQEAIETELEPRIDVTWIDSAGSDIPKSVPEGGLYVFLPSLPATGDRFRVGVSDWCGNVCGRDQRYLVARRGDRWTARPVGALVVA